MIRFLVFFLLAMLLLPLIRAVLATVTKGFRDLTQPGSPSAGPKRRPPAQAGGELKRDPVCGTFIDAASSLKKTVGGETFYFCSTECRDKFQR